MLIRRLLLPLVVAVGLFVGSLFGVHAMTTAAETQRPDLSEYIRRIAGGDPLIALAEAQKACMPANEQTSFTHQFHCIEATLGSLDGDSTDPYVALYLLTGQKLVGEVAQRRTTSATARVELQKAFLDVTQRYNEAAASKAVTAIAEQNAQREEAQRQQEAALADASQKAEVDKAELERVREQTELSARATEAQAAVQSCVAATKQRLTQQWAQREAQAAPGQRIWIENAANQALSSVNAQELQSICAANPNYYLTISDTIPEQVRNARSRSDCTLIGETVTCDTTSQ